MVACGPGLDVTIRETNKVAAARSARCNRRLFSIIPFHNFHAILPIFTPHKNPHPNTTTDRP
jgi:hypothetical protein